MTCLRFQDKLVVKARPKSRSSDDKFGLFLVHHSTPKMREFNIKIAFQF